MLTQAAEQYASVLSWGSNSRALDCIPSPYGTHGPTATGDELEHHQISFSQCMVKLSSRESFHNTSTYLVTPSSLYHRIIES